MNQLWLGHFYNCIYGTIQFKFESVVKEIVTILK